MFVLYRVDGGLVDDNDEGAESSLSHAIGDNFVKTVESILHPPKKSTAPILKYVIVIGCLV